MTQFKYNPGSRDKKDSFANWFIPAALGNMRDKTFSKIIEKKDENGGFVVTMQINGVEIPCEEALIRLGEQFDRLIDKNAEEIANDLFQKELTKHVDFFDSLFDGVKKKISDEVRKKLGIKIEQE